MREEGTYTDFASSSILKTIALPKNVSVAYPPLVVAPNVQSEVYWRAGFYRRGTGTGWPGEIDDFFGTAYYGLWDLRKNRIDTSYSRTADPEIYFDCTWTNFYLLQGSSSGECTGKTWSDRKHHGRNAGQWDGNYLMRTYILPGPAPPYFGPDFSPDWVPYMEANSIKADIEAALVPYPPVLGGPGVVTTTALANDRPVNTGSYTFTSRYAIDFDQKGQFYAAIKVVVECSGAEWRESGVFEGNMSVYADPDYAVSIYLETNWKGTVAETELLTVTASRPAFEFTVLQKQNPYYWRVINQPEKQTMFVRTPPSFGIPAEGMSQIPTICTHQGVNPHLVCADVRPDAVGNVQSTAGIEFSTIKKGQITPHKKYVTGQLYARTFKISDFPDSLWLLHSTKCDVKENDGLIGPSWFYMPALKAAIDSTTFRVEVRDGVHEHWSDEFMPGSSPPAFISRVTKLYRV